MEAKHGVHLNERQKAWYYAKEKTLGDDMKREYPTIPAEAFQQSVEGAYYAKQFRWLYTNKRICKLPDNSHLPVHTFWDNVLADAIGRGINPRETASIISKRLDVSMSKADNIAQTEQVGALRQAQWAETEWAKERLGLNTMLLHLSALKPTTRMNHAYWHGRLRTVADVREWYSIDGNKYRCYCSQIPVIVDDNGKLLNPNLIERLVVERKQWQETEGITT
ncbi:hypothetical protein GNO67_004252 [Yersinia enterocolitica]|nr:hypothetical protein [Yersinia enterocolitica]EKN4736255.1 hypothetical protein [Yersinia enterocolitica]